MKCVRFVMIQLLIFLEKPGVTGVVYDFKALRDSQKYPSKRRKNRLVDLCVPAWAMKDDSLDPHNPKVFESVES